MARDDNNPSWRTCDFNLKDCSSEANWVKDAKRYREQSGLKAKADQMWFENLPEDKPPLPAGEADQYVWQQSDEEVEVTFRSQLFRGIHATRRDVTVKIGALSLFVRLRGRVLLDAKLHREVKPSVSYWTFTQQTHELQISLVKEKREIAWTCLCSPVTTESAASEETTQSNSGSKQEEDLKAIKNATVQLDLCGDPQSDLVRGAAARSPLEDALQHSGAGHMESNQQNAIDKASEDVPLTLPRPS